jgi:hypothetical protein
MDIGKFTYIGFIYKWTDVNPIWEKYLVGDDIKQAFTVYNRDKNAISISVLNYDGFAINAFVDYAFYKGTDDATIKIFCENLMNKLIEFAGR